MQNTFQTDHFLELQPVCKGRFHYYSELASTSDYAKKLVEKGADSGTLVLAEHQTMGRGRGGNTWLSTTGESLLFTLVIEPDVDQQYWNRFSLIAGVALVKAINDLSNKQTNLKLKWPNDVYLNGKKCAGILTEIVGDKVVIGIGLNISAKEFPNEISAKATSLLREGIALQREPALAAIISEIFKTGSMAGGSFAKVISDYKHNCLLTGKLIKFTAASQPREGIVTGIGDNGTLLVTGSDGRETSYMEARDIVIQTSS